MGKDMKNGQNKKKKNTFFGCKDFFVMEKWNQRNTLIQSIFGILDCENGKLPLRLLPEAALTNWIAESIVVFTSLASPIFGQTSTKSNPRRRPLSKTLSIILMPSRSDKPPGTVIEKW